MYLELWSENLEVGAMDPRGVYHHHIFVQLMTIMQLRPLPDCIQLRPLPATIHLMTSYITCCGKSACTADCVESLS